MTYKQLIKFLHSFELVIPRYSKILHYHRFTMRGHVFAIVAYNPKKKIITLEVRNSLRQTQILREKYPELLKPSRYCNPNFWSSIELSEDIPEDPIKKLLNASYRIALKDDEAFVPTIVPPGDGDYLYESRALHTVDLSPIADPKKFKEYVKSIKDYAVDIPQYSEDELGDLSQMEGYQLFEYYLKNRKDIMFEPREDEAEWLKQHISSLEDSDDDD